MVSVVFTCQLHNQNFPNSEHELLKCTWSFLASCSLDTNFSIQAKAVLWLPRGTTNAVKRSAARRQILEESQCVQVSAVSGKFYATKRKVISVISKFNFRYDSTYIAGSVCTGHRPLKLESLAAVRYTSAFLSIEVWVATLKVAMVEATNHLHALGRKHCD